MEIDWSVGQILATLTRLNLDDNTLVLFSSDNGPWLSYGNHAGSAGIYREGKGTTWEGGHRVPFIARWPGKIPAGRTCDEFCATIDILPTCVKLAGGTTPAEQIIDGKDIWPLLTEKESKSPHEVFYYYWDTGLDAVRSREWKLHFPHAYRALLGKPGKDGQPGGYVQTRTELALYNLQSDPSEKTNVATEHPEVVARLQKLAEVARDDLGDSLTKRAGKNIRPAGKLKE